MRGEKRGRPQNLMRRGFVEKCQKKGCQNPPAPNQIYCCKDHAPYGNYGENWGDLARGRTDEDTEDEEGLS